MGGKAYDEALARCSPGVAFSAVNPFLEQPLPNAVLYRAVPLYGVLASSKRGEVDRVPLEATSALKRDGLLACHDSFLPPDVVPSHEAVLGTMARRITRDGCREGPVEGVLESLARLGFVNVRSEALPTDTFLVTARKS